MNHVMVDLETMGLRPDAAIISIGAVFFDETSMGDKFYCPIHLESAKAIGMTTDKSTEDWWAKQSEDARAAWDSPDAPLILDVMVKFSEFVRKGGQDVRIWGNGASFDPVILESAYRLLDADPPWKFYNVRCFRTMKSMFTYFPVPRSGTHHHALDDAIHQTKELQAILHAHQIKLV